MRRLLTPIALLCASVAIISYPATASGITLHKRVVLPHGVTRADPDHLVVVDKVPPPDSDDDGYADADDACPHESYTSNGGCEPEPVVTYSTGSSTSTSAESVSYSTDGSCGGITPYYGAGQCWAIPYDIVSCESGGSLTAQNPSGAYGAYQLLGHGEYEGMSKSEQDAMAADVWAGGAGRDAWVC